MANADGPLGDRTLPMLITALSRVTKNNMCTSSKIGMGRRFAEAGVSPASAGQAPHSVWFAHRDYEPSKLIRNSLRRLQTVSAQEVAAFHQLPRQQPGESKHQFSDPSNQG